MSEPDLTNKHPLHDAIAEISCEIQQIPAEHWPNLLQIIRLFRESMTKASGSSDPWK